MTVGTCHLPQFIQVTDNRGTSAITLQVRRRRPAKWLAQRGGEPYNGPTPFGGEAGEGYPENVGQ